MVIQLDVLWGGDIDAEIARELEAGRLVHQFLIGGGGGGTSHHLESALAEAGSRQAIGVTAIWGGHDRDGAARGAVASDRASDGPDEYELDPGGGERAKELERRLRDVFESLGTGHRRRGWRGSAVTKQHGRRFRARGATSCRADREIRARTQATLTVMPAGSRTPSPSLFMRDRPSATIGIVAATIAVGATTLAIYPLEHVAPYVSLSVVYLPAVLFASAVWGLPLGLFTSLLSAAAFNFFHLPPVGRFTISDPRNWVALAAFTTVAIVASWMAGIARSRTIEAERRRAEADLAASLSRDLLAGADTPSALAIASHRLTVALSINSAAIVLGSDDGDERRRAIPLRDAARNQIATLLVPRALPADTIQRLQSQVAPSLEAIIAIALQRDRIQAEAVETAALRRSDDVKTALLRAVSHDLRSPLTTIVAAGHLLSSPSLTEEDRVDLSNAVVSEGERLASLVSKLLDLSKLQSGGAAPRREWVSVEDVINAARDGLALDGPAPVILLNIDPDLPDVHADAAQLERVFANLLENAARYAGSGPVSVNASAVGSRVVVSVVDQGPGIAVADRDRIFEPFYRGRPAGTSGDERWTGSGLGLAIAKGFVEGNGGTITVESLPGQGTSVIVSLPMREPSVVAEPEPAEPEPAEPEPEPEPADPEPAR